MNDAPTSTLQPKHVIRILRRYPWRWIGPTLVVALATVIFVVVCPPPWQASQALIVRNEAVSSRDEPGQFNHADQMKSVQETILEVARSRNVLAAALAEVGPPADYQKPRDVWPSATDVEDLRETVELTPPHGAEFGSTEVFYLNVKNRDRDRAVALAAAVCDQLESRIREIRDTKATSMLDELNRTVALAQADLDESTSRLVAIEQRVGADLPELRVLNESNTGDSALQRTGGEIRNELRQAEAANQANEELLALLRASRDDPAALVATPNSLLASQPALERLKDGLIDAQLRTAELEGRMSSEHPLVRAALESEAAIRRHLHDELDSAVRGIQVDLRLGAERIATLRRQLDATNERLDHLASLRAAYANSLAQTRHRTELLEQAEQNRAYARASQASANAASLITRVDDPETGTRRIGPGRTMLCLMGAAAGLLLGLGILTLTVEPDEVREPAAHNHHTPTPAHEGNGHADHTAGKPLQPGLALSLGSALRRLGTPALSRN